MYNMYNNVIYSVQKRRIFDCYITLYKYNNVIGVISNRERREREIPVIEWISTKLEGIMER